MTGGRGPVPRFLACFATRFVVALAIASAVVGAGLVLVDRVIRREVDRIPRVAVQTAPEPDGGANYLVVGSDSREFVETEAERASFGDPSQEAGRRSDTIMVVHVEPDAQRTLVVSFPRDLWVEVPGIGEAKINAAFNSDLGGGPDTVIATLRENFGIEVNHYLEVDFVTFRSIVDSVGSVPVYFDRPAVDEFTGFIVAKAGCYQLNGADALAWVRARHLRFLDPQTGRLEEDARADIGRIERQQEFIRRLVGTVVERTLDNPLEARDIADAVVPYLRVDDSFDTRDALDLVAAFRSVRADDTSALEFVTFPFTDGTQAGQSVLLPDREAAAPLLERIRRFGAPAARRPVEPSEVRVRVLNASGREGLALRTADALAAAGFVRAGTGNDIRGRVAVTEVRYANNAEAKARRLLDVVGPGTRLVGDPTVRDADVVLVLGADFAGLVTQPADAPSGTPGPDAAVTGPAAGAAAECR